MFKRQEREASRHPINDLSSVVVWVCGSAVLFSWQNGLLRLSGREMETVWCCTEKSEFLECSGLADFEINPKLKISCGTQERSTRDSRDSCGAGIPLTRKICFTYTREHILPGPPLTKNVADTSMIFTAWSFVKVPNSTSLVHDFRLSFHQTPSQKRDMGIHTFVAKFMGRSVNQENTEEPKPRCPSKCRGRFPWNTDSPEV
jgi:hypothetical protein